MPLRWLVAQHLVAVKDDVEEDLTKIVGVMTIVQRLETAAVTWTLFVPRRQQQKQQQKPS